MAARRWILALAGVASAFSAKAQMPIAGALGPYDLTVLQGGVGMTRSLPSTASILTAGAPWTATSWVKCSIAAPGLVVLVSLGDPASGASVSVVLNSGRLGLRAGSQRIDAKAELPVGEWRALAVVYDGKAARLYLDGVSLGGGPLSLGKMAPILSLAPALGAPGQVQHFGGMLAHLQILAGVMSPNAIKALAASKPSLDLTTYTAVGAGWPVQERAWIGLQAPQDAWTLPHSRTPFNGPASATPALTAALEPEPNHVWTLGAWQLAAAPQVTEGGAVLSQPGYGGASWYAATVPGTVLTTLIDQGVYPDPDFGLNNLAIPESLARQDYWYRTSFNPPSETTGRRLTLTFKGINYAAEVWLNGANLGRIRGAFIRGVFDVTDRIKPGQLNTLAVRISPPPHPGIPSEESIAYGPGENGGAMTIDGPTFMPTEGWDWIPAIRDRDTGIWQDVELQATGAVRLVDPTVITHLSLPSTDEADLQILTPVDNQSAAPRQVTIEAAFDGVDIEKTVALPPGRSQVRFDPSDFAQLKVKHPALWWPNGYGPATLHTLTVTVHDGGDIADVQAVRFGIREITYDLSLFDHRGALRRVQVNPTLAFARGERVVDARHEAIKQTPNGWAASLTLAGEASPAVSEAPMASLAPYMVIRVNGLPIAVRGGSWGMDDSRKRISRARLEPYFRLHKEAHVNIIRNWLGQNTEDIFYDLADEYGMLVLNDFWESTQDFQIEAQDPALFLANARDVILRYRRHPSIAVWFGRNEGVPQPIINDGLADLVSTLDGTRYYTGSSNRVNLQDSGPYNYRPPAQYFTSLAKGFSVEVGTPSLGTLEAIKSSIPAADRWPISDALAYHDWHFGGNGDVKSFMAALNTQFGAPTSLEDFERKAQMMNYVDYRAIFEGFFAHLWTENSGRLLWMTHPAWPSNHWQMYTSDYDTQASYYGVKKAAEPLHVQMNLPDYGLAVINTTREDKLNLTLLTRVISLNNKVLLTRVDHLSAMANQVTTLKRLDLAPYLAKEDVVLVALTLKDALGAMASQNLYWQGKDEASLQRLNHLSQQTVGLSADADVEGNEVVIRAEIKDNGTEPALETKLTLVNDLGDRILPAYYSENYISLLPGEGRKVEIRYPRLAGVNARLNVRGWNINPSSVAVNPPP